MEAQEQVAVQKKKGTKINKVVFNGFKSFAKHTEILFSDKYNCVLGPNGSGKCVTGETLVHMADGSLTKIDKLVNKKIKTNSFKKIDDGFIIKGDYTKILCLDTKTLKVKEKNVAAFVKRTSPEKLVTLRTKSGREITSTTYHPLFVLEKDNIKSVNAEDLKEGARIAVPRVLPNKFSNNFYELIDIIKEEDNLYAPFKNEYKEALKSIKNTTLKDLSLKLNIPLNALKGLNDEQSINFSHLIKILRLAEWNNKEIAKKITHVKGKTTSNLCKVPWKNSKEFSRILGYLIAEGRLTKSNQVWFTNGCEEIIKDYALNIVKLFEVHTTINEYKPNCYDVISYSKPLETILTKFGMSFKGTGDKSITNLFLKNSGDEEISSLLNGLYCGDGYVSKNSIEIVTKSQKLSKSIQILLSRLGIISNLKLIIKKAANTGFSGLYYQISFYGQENFTKFQNKIKLAHPEKLKRLNNLSGKKINPNQDLIETNFLVKKVADELSVNIKNSKKQFPKLDAYSYNQCTPSVNGTKQLLEELFIPAANSQQMQKLISLQKLDLFCNSDIYWDEIIEINKVKSKEKWVYDLCVEKDHNFIANNIFVHNSNVLDALCFVLGKSSAKSLRAEKSSNLIYNGGKSKKPAKSGEVSVYFDNKCKIFPTEEDEVKITRIVKQSGQSVYKINDEARTRTEILDLLGIVKINPDGYNIILQGDIVKLVEMHPNDRRELIGEIAGISVYEEKRHKAVLELNKTEEKLKETEIVLAERNTYLKELKKDRDQALKYKDMNDRIKVNKASYLKIQIDKKEKERDELQGKLDETKAELDKVNGKISEIRKQNEEKRAEIDKITKEIEEKGEVEQVNLNKEVETLKVDLARKHSRIDALDNELEKIKQRKVDLKEGVKEIEDKISELGNQKEEMQKDIEAKQKERKEVSDRIKHFKEKNEIDNLGDIEKQIGEIDKKEEKIQKEVQTAREQQHNFIREKDKAEHGLAAIDAQIAKVNDVEKEHKSQLDEINKKRKDFKSSTLDLNKKLDGDSILVAQLTSARRKIHEKTEELAKLNARNITAKELSYGDIAIKRILELKKQKPEIYGTVAELGNVDSKYSLALEIAAGGKIKSVVVDDDKTASECIKYLKDNKLGVVTFLPLNKINPRPISSEAKKITKSNGCHGLALDLVSYDNKFKKIFEFVFSDTIVVDNIDVARRLGIGNARYATIDGDLAERSGAMHGGYRLKRKHSLGFKEKGIEEDIQNIEGEIKELKNTIDALEKKRIENEEIITELRTKKAHLEGEIIKTEKSLYLDSTDLEASKDKKESLGKYVGEVDDKLRLAQEKISTLNKELALVKTEKQKLRSSIAQLRNPALIAELNVFEEKYRQLNEEILKIDSEIKLRDIQSESIYKNELEKTDKIVKQLEKDGEEFGKELDELKKEVAAKEEELNKKEAMAQEFYAKFKGLFHKRSEIDKEIQKNEGIVNNKQDSSRQVEIKANTLSLKHAEMQAALAGLQQEFQQYEGVKLDLERNEEQLKNEIRKFERMREQIGSVNMRALEIYDEVEKQYHILLEKKETLNSEKEDVFKMMEEIEGKKKELFMKVFEVVNENFQKFFTSLTTKGAQATLVIEDKENPFEAGVRINVKITGSKFLDIRSLSGGEKTMTALAFVFAIQEHDPASFYILDEVDAALDKHNSEKFAKLIRQYSERAQYVIISHNDAVISEADTLYGVSMNEHGMSQVVSLKI